MDILKEIEKQISSIKRVDSSAYLDSIYNHLDRAEIYYKQGKNDNNFFNDVIYRSNQAYEGALKESYKVLADKSDEEVIKKTPNDIEIFFESNNIFKERVLQLFKNYRKEWRNKSTHDYKLVFDENEAFIALTSVTSFTHLLLKQIQEKIAYITQHEILKKERTAVEKVSKIIESKNISSLEKLIEIIKGFAEQNREIIYSSENIKEFEIIGLFHAYIETVSKNFHIQREPKLNFGGINLRPDFLIEYENETIILEFKRQKPSGSNFQNAVNQLLLYMQVAKVSKGIIYYSNFSQASPEVKVEKITRLLNDRDYQIVCITT